MGIVVVIIIAGIGLYIWYHLIQSAIEQSKMAQHIKEIRDLLVELHKDKNIQTQSQVQETPDSVQPSYDTECCPACGKRVTMDNTLCPECGLTLANTEN